MNTIPAKRTSPQFRQRSSDEPALKRINRHIRRRHRFVCARWVGGRTHTRIQRYYFLIDERRQTVLRVFVGLPELQRYFAGLFPTGMPEGSPQSRRAA